MARRMGATKGRVDHYYRAKLDLFVDVVRHGLEIIHRDVTAARVAAPDPATRMAAMVRAHLRSILLEQPFHRAALQGVELHLT
ncbi:MAG: TetR/AcrR family transcriptional regulator, partial [Pseudomonadota bacterium]